MIRPFSDKDLHRVATLFLCVFSLPPWREDWSYEEAYNHIEEVSHSPGFIGFVAVSEEHLVAALLGHLQDTTPNRTFRIEEIFVEFGYQRQGIGSALLRHLFQQAAALGVQSITATTLVEDSAASFYLRQGFRDIGPVSYSARKHIFERT